MKFFHIVLPLLRSVSSDFFIETQFFPPFLSSTFSFFSSLNPFLQVPLSFSSLSLNFPKLQDLFTAFRHCVCLVLIEKLKPRQSKKFFHELHCVLNFPNHCSRSASIILYCHVQCTKILEQKNHHPGPQIRFQCHSNYS